MEKTAQTHILRRLMPVQIVLMITVAIIISTYLQRQFQERVDDRLLRTANLVADNIDKHIRGVRNLNALVASRTQLRISLKQLLEDAGSTRDRDKIRRILNDARNSTTDILGIYIVDETRKMIAHSSTTMVPLSDTVFGTNYQFENDYQIVKVPGIGFVELFEMPLKLETQRLGSLFVVSSLEEFIDELKETSSLTGASGAIQLFRMQSNKPVQNLVSVSNNQLNTHTINSIDESSGVQIFSNPGADFPQLDYRGKRIIYQSRILSDWNIGVLVYVDQAEVSDNQLRLFWIVLTGLIFTIMVLSLITIVVINRMVWPLTRLSDWSIARLGGARIPVPDNSNYREIALLTENLKRLTEESDDIRNHLRDLVYNVPVGLITVDELGKITRFNQHCEVMFGFHERELVGQSIEILIPDADEINHTGLREKFYSQPESRIMGVGRDVQAMRKDSSVFDVEIALTPFKTSNESLTIVSISDISKRKAQEKQLLLNSETDVLTGIHNRRYMERRFAEEFSRAGRSGEWVGMMMVDIDHFKTFNDVAGHDQGDNCLKQVASVLAGFFNREGDFCARYGGEEFAAVCYGNNLEAMEKFGRKICNAIARENIHHPGLGNEGIVTVSIGVAARQVESGDSPETLLKAADEGLYRAKNNGRNQVSSN